MKIEGFESRYLMRKTCDENVQYVKAPKEKKG